MTDREAAILDALRRTLTDTEAPEPPQKRGLRTVKWILVVFICGLPIVALGGFMVDGFGSVGYTGDPALSRAYEHGDAAAARLRKAFRRVEVGDPTTGKGGMTIAQVVALMGRPDEPHADGSITAIRKDGHKVIWYTYLPRFASYDPAWDVFFTNGRVSGKRSL